MTPDEVLERTQWDAFWVPSDVTVVDRPELMALSCPRQAPHLNCVTRTRASRGRAGELVSEVVRLHSGRVSRWLVCRQSGARELEPALAAGGYDPSAVHDACVLGTAAYRRRPAPGIDVRPVTTLPVLRDAHRVLGRAFSLQERAPHDVEQTDLLLCTAPDARVFRYVAYLDGEAVATGGLTAFPELRFGLLWGGGTVPESRGRGAYSAVLAARIDRARGLGLALVGLYARLDTSAPIVERQGFARHGRMTYWERPA